MQDMNTTQVVQELRNEAKIDQQRGEINSLKAQIAILKEIIETAIQRSD